MSASGLVTFHSLILVTSLISIAPAPLLEVDTFDIGGLYEYGLTGLTLDKETNLVFVSVTGKFDEWLKPASLLAPARDAKCQRKLKAHICNGYQSLTGISTGIFLHFWDNFKNYNLIKICETDKNKNA